MIYYLQSIGTYANMPSTHRSKIKHFSSAIEPYPPSRTSHNSQASAPQQPLLDSFIILTDPEPNTLAPSPNFPQPSSTVPGALLEIPQGRGTGRATQERPSYQSEARPRINSQSVLLKSRSFGKSRKEIHHTYTREFKLQVLSFWLHYKIPIGPMT